MVDLTCEIHMLHWKVCFMVEGNEKTFKP
jgi:hypothetical protein